MFIGGLIFMLVLIAIFFIAKSMNASFIQSTFSMKDMKQLIEQSYDIIYYYEIYPTEKHLYISPSVDKLLGEGTRHKLMTEHAYPYEAIHPDDLYIFENKVSGNMDYSKPIIQRFRSLEGTYHFFEEYITPVYKKGQLIAIQGVLRNIDDKVRLENEITYQLSHDVLTDLYNRHFFEQQIQRLNEQENHAVTLILCDLDRLKHVNDSFGHQAGDNFIITAANVLQKTFHPHTVARIGGDEFAIIVEHLHVEDADIVTIIANLHKAIDEFNADDQLPIPLSISVGLASTAQSIGHMHTLFTQADLQMYDEKRLKKQHLPV